MSERLFLDADWKRWVAENVLLGRPADELASILTQHGFDSALARLEVDTAAAHPYVAAAASLARQLAKRDWVLHTQRELLEQGPVVEELDRPVDRDVFERDHYRVNRPLLVRGGAAALPALTRWTPGYLKSAVGDREVQIQGHRDGNPDYELDDRAHRRRCRFHELVDRIFSGAPSNDFYLTANNADANAAALAPLWPDLLPLPDMLDPAQADGRLFLWLGPAGTVTPLHHDLTNNLMIQVQGRKRLLLAAPGYQPWIYNHVHCYSRVDPEHVDAERYPMFREVRLAEVHLGPGDVLFLPVGWWHHVRALTASVTVTCTNFRGGNRFTDRYHSYGAL